MDSKQTIVLFLFFAFALNITLCQDQVPAPYNFAVLSVTETSVTLGWVAPDSGTGYELTISDKNGVRVAEQITIINLSTISTVISSLYANLQYTFTIRTVSGASFSRGISVIGQTLPTPTNIIISQTEGKSEVKFEIIFQKGKGADYKFLLELRQNYELVLQVMSNTNNIIVSGLSDEVYTPTVMATFDNYKGLPFTGKPVTLTGVTAEADVSAPTNLNVDVWGTIINLKWSPADSGTGYQVTVDSDPVPYYVDGLDNSRFYSVPLSPCTEYSFTVRTTSEGSKLSEKITSPSIRTDGPRVTQASVEETELASGKLTVYWNPIKPIESCDWEFDIRLTFSLRKMYHAVASGTESSYELYNVAEHNYELMVSTSLNGALGQSANTSFIKTAFTAGNAPDDPTILKVTDQSTTTVSLSWMPANEVVGYQYTLAHKDPKFIIDGGSVTGTKITGLTPSTNYTITVSSLTESSKSKGVEISATTKRLEQETK